MRSQVKAGKLGGYARARNLSKRQRIIAARKAATARWNRIPALDASDLRTVVAHHGSRAAGLLAGVDVEESVTEAVSASRHDASLTRMVPVFLWRMRQMMNCDLLLAKTTDRKRLYFFVCLLHELAGGSLPPELLKKLTPDSSLPNKGTPPEPFFEHSHSSRSGFEKLVEEQNTPSVARKCGYLMNMPMESFADYFSRTCRL